MENNLFVRRVGFCLLTGVLTGFSVGAYASAFQIWEEGSSGTGTYQAGGAAIANTAETSFYNPAGLVRLKHQEISVGAAMITTKIKYRGAVREVVPPFFDYQNNNVKVNGGDTNVIPNFHYAMPINPSWVFGFDITTPLGLDTNYGKRTDLRYVATKTTVQALNISPSVGFKANDKLSLGLGVDAQRLKAEFNEVGGIGELPSLDKQDENKLFDWGFGFHAGVLYQFTPSTRVGLSYRSKITHHAKGASIYTDPSAGITRSTNLKTTLIMPATTMLSYYQDINKMFAWMASATYSQWGAFNKLVLKNAAGEDASGNPITNLTISAPQHFRNTWNLALGTIITLNPRWQLKAGIGYDESPVRTRYRTVQVPDRNHRAFSLGTHYQPTKALGFDLGWTHIFIGSARVNSQIQVGPETVLADGHVKSSANVFGGQLTYDFL